MHLLLATDSFKHSCSAVDATSALQRGWSRVFPSSTVDCCPLGDGGEGTLEAIVKATNVHQFSQTVTILNGEQGRANWLQLPNRVAFIEMAQTAGLQLVPYGKTHPLHATTYGVGEQIRAALDAGAQSILLGVGGSGTHDVGIGMASALGYRFFDQNDQLIPQPTGKDLKHVAKIDSTQVDDRLKRVNIQLLCDVDNPLTGERGAAFTYARQKGATPNELPQIEMATRQFLKTALNWKPELEANLPGGGAAGGMGFAGYAFLGGQLVSGASIIAELVQLEARIQRADLVVTGEGAIDEQTLNGKLVNVVAKMARQHQKPIIGVCGALLASADTVQAIGLNAAYSIVRQAQSLETAFAEAEQNLEYFAEQLARTVKATRS